MTHWLQAISKSRVRGCIIERYIDLKTLLFTDYIYLQQIQYDINELSHCMTIGCHRDPGDLHTVLTLQVSEPIWDSEVIIPLLADVPEPKCAPLPSSSCIWVSLANNAFALSLRAEPYIEKFTTFLHFHIFEDTPIHHPRGNILSCNHVSPS